MDISTKELPSALKKVLKAGLVPFVSGMPGIAKSAIIKQLAIDYSLEFIDVRLSQLDNIDLSGLPTIINGKVEFIPPKDFPLDTDPIPEGKAGWLIFLDEFNAAAKSVEAAAYKILLDRKIGQHNLHPTVFMLAAGNRTGDRAIVNRLSTATQSRLVHFNLAMQSDHWLEWAREADIDYRVTSFIEFQPSILNSFKPSHSDNTFPCSRTWTFVSQLISGVEDITMDYLPILAGTVGEGAAAQFKKFTEIFNELPKIDSILRNPTSVDVPTEPGICYAVGGLVGHHLSVDTADRLMKYIIRLPNDFQILTLRSALAKDKSLVKHKAIKTWIKTNGMQMLMELNNV